MNMIRRERLTSETRALANKPHSGFMFVGRPSAVGNPFVIGRDGSRSDVIGRFEQWFDSDTGLQGEFLRAARYAWKPGFGIMLLCYCHANEACHADVLVTFLKERSK